MADATHDDIVRVFPGIPDHAVLEILAMHATVAELDAASLLLQDADEGLLGVKQRHGDRLSRLLAILGKSGIRAPDDADR